LDRLKGAIDDQVKEVFQRSGASLFSGFAFTKMTVKQMQGCVNIEGLELLKSVLAEGKGAIILLAHMGPWEALTQLPDLAKLQDIDASFGVMYRPLNNHYLEQLYRGAREGKGTHLFSRRDGFHKPVDFLRSGGMLGILADQKMRQGATVPYFGRNVSTNPVPGLFHKRSGAPIIGLALNTVGDAKWEIQIRSVDLPSESSAADRATLAIACNQGLEGILSESFLDGFWFHKRF
jgi:KDO2-lipid IV(A) lauroyltransferase